MRGQGALEYLMTYGWALLVVVVVGAALYSLGILNPRTYVNPTCVGFATFNAVEFKLTEKGNFTLIVDNGPNSVWIENITLRQKGTTSWDNVDNVTGASCGKDPAAPRDCTDPRDGNIGPNARHSFDVDDSALAGSTGSPWAIDVAIKYNTQNLEGHQDFATCNGLYEPATE